jgi:hypothetical protein
MISISCAPSLYRATLGSSKAEIGRKTLVTSDLFQESTIANLPIHGELYRDRACCRILFGRSLKPAVGAFLQESVVPIWSWLEEFLVTSRTWKRSVERTRYSDGEKPGIHKSFLHSQKRREGEEERDRNSTDYNQPRSTAPTSERYPGLRVVGSCSGWAV